MGEHRARTRQLFDELHRLGPLSNQELAELFDLSPASITQLVQPLLQDGLLRSLPASAYPESRRPDDGKSRRKATLHPDPARGSVLGACLAGGKLTVYCFDFSLACQPALVVEEEPGRNADAEAIADALARAARQAPSRVLAAGLAVRGRRDPDSGAISFGEPEGLGGTSDPGAALSRAAGIPCRLENDANALAVYERFAGLARGTDHFMCLYADEGVGTGIFVNGGLYEGWRNMAGEIGHWIVDPNGPELEGLPRGCFEAYVSRPAIARRLQDLGLALHGADPWTALLADNDGAFSGSLAAQGLLAEIAQACALLCVNLFHIFAPRKIFLYGPLAAFGPAFRTPFLKAAHELTSHERRPMLLEALIARPDSALAMSYGAAKTALDATLFPAAEA